MTTDDRTAHLDLPLPHIDNQFDEDVGRIRTAFSELDAAVMAPVIVTGTSQAAVAGSHYILTNVAATTVTLPASPADLDQVWVTPVNSLITNVIARNGQTIVDDPTDLLLDIAGQTARLIFVNASWRLL